MIFLKNDYSIGAHPAVLEALIRNNMTLSDSYCHDTFTENAVTMIRELIGKPEADIHFAAGGTLTNLTCMSAFLKPYEALICPDCAHVYVHETGAIEATGHKCIELPSPDGKILPEQIERVVKFHDFDQMVLPKLVYLSDTTEYGSVYTREELTAIREVCDRYGLYLYIDGARLAMALASSAQDMTFADIADICDAFYIGGTKCGALFGEAIVIINDDLKPNFRFIMRRHGALFAKGMLLGMQFEALMKDGLYLELGRKADTLGLKLADALAAKGIKFAWKPQSNMIFPVFTYEKADALAKEVMYEKWMDNYDGTRTIRFVTSWATEESEIDRLLTLI